MRMATFGAVVHGPSGHLWYTLLDTRVMPEKSTSPEAIVAKMALDQALFAPVFTAVFYAALTAMEGRPDEIVEVISTCATVILSSQLNHIICGRFHSQKNLVIQLIDLLGDLTDIVSKTATLVCYCWSDVLDVQMCNVDLTIRNE